MLRIKILPTVLMVVKRNWRISTIALLIFIPLLFLFTGILNRFLFVPEHYPHKPTIFKPQYPLFDQYTFAWKLSDRWLLQITFTDALWLLVLSCLFFINIALMSEIYKTKARFTTIHWLAYPSALLAFIGCCGSFLFILLFGAGALFAVVPYVKYFRILTVALFGFNTWFMLRKLKTMPIASLSKL